jgi:hypothetical protein
MIYGVRGKREDCDSTVFNAGHSSNRFCEESYFLFVKDNRLIMYFTEESELVKECRKNGVNVIELHDFDENFRRHCLNDKSPSLVNVAKYAIDKGLRMGELVAIVIIWGVFWAIFTMCITSQRRTRWGR